MENESLFIDELSLDQKRNLGNRWINLELKKIDSKKENLNNYEYFLETYYPELDQCYPLCIRSKDESDYDFFQRLIQFEIDEHFSYIEKIKKEIQ